MSSHPAPAKAVSGELSHRQIMTILSGLMAGMFLAALDQTIVATSIRTIADDLQGLSVQAWVTTAYLITSTITTPIYGKLGDLYGRKIILQSAVVLFLAGSVLCGLSRTMTQLILFRAIQGLGGGGLMVTTQAVIGDVVPPRERGRTAYNAKQEHRQRMFAHLLESWSEADAVALTDLLSRFNDSFVEQRASLTDLAQTHASKEHAS